MLFQRALAFWLNHDVDIHGVSKAVFIRAPCYVSLPVDQHSHSWFQPNRGKVLWQSSRTLQSILHPTSFFSCQHWFQWCVAAEHSVSHETQSAHFSLVSGMSHSPKSDSDVSLHFVHNTTMTLLQGNMSLGLHLSTLNDSHIAFVIEANVSLNTGGRFGNGKGRWNVSLRLGSKTAPVCTECLCVPNCLWNLGINSWLTLILM